MKIKVGVIFGGKSVEHEVSIISGIQAINNMDKEKYDIVPIYLTKENNMYVGELVKEVKNFKNIKNVIENSQRVIMVNNEGRVDLIKYPMKKFGNNLYDSIDVALPVVHGTNVEDGALQGFLKTLDIPFAGCDVLSSAIGIVQAPDGHFQRHGAAQSRICPNWCSVPWTPGQAFHPLQA